MIKNCNYCKVDINFLNDKIVHGNIFSSGMDKKQHLFRNSILIVPWKIYMPLKSSPPPANTEAWRHYCKISIQAQTKMRVDKKREFA